MNSNDKKIKRFRKRDIIIIILFLLIAVVSVELFRRDLLQTFRLLNVEPVGTVVLKKNTAQRRLGDRVVWDRLARESSVYVWDLIRIADDSAAILYVLENSIDLSENTLIRIVPSPDGRGVMIVLGSGNITLASSNGDILLDIDGQRFRPAPGTIFNGSITEDGRVYYREYLSIDQFTEAGNITEISGPDLYSPIISSMYLFNENLPVLFFRWEELEEAESYILEVSDTPDFTNTQIRRQTTSVSLTDTGLGEGVWYWRVIPVLPSVFHGYSNFSDVSFFKLEKTDAELAFDRILFNLPEPEPVTQPAAQRAVQPAASAVASVPPSLLAAPQNLQPVNRTIYGHTQLQSLSAIVFSWSSVQGANAYIFTLYHQTSAGRRQIIRTTINRGTSYTLDNMRLLDRGNFVWQVEAVNMGRNNVIERRGRIAESMYTIDFQSPGPVRIEDTGILYGN